MKPVAVVSPPARTPSVATPPAEPQRNGGVPAPDAPKWSTGSFNVTCGGSNRLTVQSGLIATITDQQGNPSCRGTWLSLSNTTSETIYYGLSGVVNMQIGPRAGDLVGYPVDRTGPNDKRPTVATMVVRFRSQ